MKVFTTADIWKPDNGEARLLAFLEELILDLGRTHARVTEAQVALWLARVIVGSSRGR